MSETTSKNEEQDLNNTEPLCLVDVFGSCVSRSIFHNGNPEAKGCADPRIKINRYFFRHSILSCMVPPPNTKELNATVANELSNDVIRTQEGFFKALKEELLKTVLPMIRESNGDYFVFDLFDMFTLHMLYDNTILTNIDCVMFSLDAYRKKPEDFSTFFPFDLPIGLWYGYVKLFMDEIVEKYGADHVVLVRLTACGSYISKNKQVLPFSEQASGFYTATPKYNKQARELEERIINDYHPNVIDYTKYYIDDEGYWSNLQGAHFAKGCYTESFKRMKEILLRPEGDTRGSLIFSQLSYEGISDILKTPIPEEQFMVMWQQIVSPVREVKGVPALERLATYPDEIVIQNRLFLSNLFLVAESVSYILENELFTGEEKDWLFYRRVDELMPKPYTDVQLQIIRDIFREALEEGDTFSFECRGQESENALYSFEPVFEKFLVLFENDNLTWIVYLLQAEKLNPDHPETLQYLLHYATALEDAELIEYYESRLRQR